MPSYIEALLQRLQNPNSPKDDFDLDEAKRRFNNASSVKRERYLRRGGTMTWVLQEIEKHDRLRPGKSEQALRELGMTSRARLQLLIDHCSTFRKDHPYEQLYYRMVNMAGRPKWTILSLEEQLLAIAAYACTEWDVLIDANATRHMNMQLRTEHVYGVLTLIFPEVRDKINVDGLRRFLAEVVEADKALFTLAWEGEKKVWEHFLLKLPNTVGGVNFLWQSDGHVLKKCPVRRKDGSICTMTLVSVMDAFTGCVPEYELVPRNDEDEHGTTKRVDFRRDDVCMLLALAIRKCNVQPRHTYTDNGAQYLALQWLLSLLRNKHGDEIIPILGFPGHPWGRGKIEEMHKQLDNALPQVLDDSAEKIPTEDELRRLVKRFFKKWNMDPRDGQPSRYHVWKTGTPQVGTAAPSADQLFHLGYVQDWERRKVHDTHIEYHGLYRLKHINPTTRARWIEAIDQTVSVWAVVYEDEHGRTVREVYACLDGKTFDELIPTTDPRPDAQRRVRKHLDDLNVLRRRRSRLAAAMTELVQAHGHERGKIAIDTIEKGAALVQKHTDPPREDDTQSAATLTAPGTADTSRGSTHEDDPHTAGGVILNKTEPAATPGEPSPAADETHAGDEAQPSSEPSLFDRVRAKRARR